MRVCEADNRIEQYAENDGAEDEASVRGGAVGFVSLVL
jgi:hypothetical protein